MAELHDLKPAPGSHRSRKRVGRGPGSGLGKTAGRGENGQKSRSGGSIPAGFEGGQMPLQRRIPKRGFTQRKRKVYQVVNVGSLGKIEGTVVTPGVLKEAGLIRSTTGLVKILGAGEVEGAYSVEVHAVSAGAREKLEAAGGSVNLEVAESPAAVEAPTAAPVEVDAPVEEAEAPAAEAEAPSAEAEAAEEVEAPGEPEEDQDDTEETEG